MKAKEISQIKMTSSELSNIIEVNREKRIKNLPSRLSIVLGDFQTEDLKGEKEMDIFEVLVRLIYRADYQSVRLISELLSAMHNDDTSELEDWTLKECGMIIKDYLRKDTILMRFDEMRNKSCEKK